MRVQKAELLAVQAGFSSSPTLARNRWFSGQMHQAESQERSAEQNAGYASSRVQIRRDGSVFFHHRGGYYGLNEGKFWDYLKWLEYIKICI